MEISRSFVLRKIKNNRHHTIVCDVGSAENIRIHNAQIVTRKTAKKRNFTRNFSRFESSDNLLAIVQDTCRCDNKCGIRKGSIGFGAELFARFKDPLSILWHLALKQNIHATIS